MIFFIVFLSISLSFVKVCDSQDAPAVPARFKLTGAPLKISAAPAANLTSAVKGVFAPPSLSVIYLATCSFYHTVGIINYNVLLFQNTISSVTHSPDVKFTIFPGFILFQITDLGVQIQGRWRVKWRIIIVTQYKWGNYKASAKGIGCTLLYQISTNKIVWCSCSVNTLSISNNDITGDSILKSIVSSSLSGKVKLIKCAKRTITHSTFGLCRHFKKQIRSQAKSIALYAAGAKA